ncbi:MAG TPA: hypothetical protein VF412_05540 [Bdellovibrio sp.]|uniref:alpha/beta hydrolase family esterase n=1 Tax=Bdellovibrio sp. TaxID=28201 RepID=UPI002F1F415C
MGKILVICNVLAAFYFVGCKNGGFSSSTGTSGDSSTVTVSVKSNQTIGSWPHTIDYYIPSNATTAIVFLHGGGGKKEGFAYNLGIKSDNTTSTYAASSDAQSWLINQKVVAIFPQGQTFAGNNWTWSNYVMTSGENDVSFLQDLVVSIKSDSSLGNITKVYVVGHSNGGMMVNRMWCESPSTFDGYVSFAGPPAPTLSGCAPSSIKPYMIVVGDTDQVLQTSGNMAATQWTIKPILVAAEPTAWVDTVPKVLNEKVYYPTRIATACGETMGSGSTSGQITTWTNCSGTIKLQVIAQTTINGSVSGGDHCLATASYPCNTTLTGTTGLDPKTAAVDFLKSF